MARVHTYKSLAACLHTLAAPRLLIVETGAGPSYGEAQFAAGDALLFGSETRGLPSSLLADYPSAPRLRIPMLAGNRSLNLSNAVALVVYEAWRQLGYAGA
jgi:tRNA (cytidine/uridine-2'-O-)-methyltransferase